eukprot:scaffold120372_cov69-Phaeocystis_antarctica.AAC.2
MNPFANLLCARGTQARRAAATAAAVASRGGDRRPPSFSRPMGESLSPKRSDGTLPGAPATVQVAASMAPKAAPPKTAHDSSSRDSSGSHNGSTGKAGGAADATATTRTSRRDPFSIAS